MPLHDPQPVLHLLRDQLAAPDKRLVFLFGAGTSSSVNIAPEPKAGERRAYVPLIPAVARMTELCAQEVAKMSPEHGLAWEALAAECRALRLDVNIESILSRLRMKMDAAGPTDTVVGLDSAGASSLEETLRTTIAGLASPGEDTIPEFVPHDHFADWIRRANRRHAVEIFTTNYDVLLERSLERKRVPVFDGFVGAFRPFFSPDALDVASGQRESRWTRLWKLHGSTNWISVGSTPARVSTTGSGDVILPSHRKYDESRKMPYLAMMDRLARTLSAPGALMVTCGYSWNDEHINEIILSGVDAHPATAVLALVFGDLDESSQVVRAATTRHNLIVLGRSEGIIRGERGVWALPKDIDGATASFVDRFYDSHAIADSDVSSITGDLVLGDFNRFCRFLNDMSPEAASDE